MRASRLRRGVIEPRIAGDLPPGLMPIPPELFLWITTILAASALVFVWQVRLDARRRIELRRIVDDAFRRAAGSTLSKSHENRESSLTLIYSVEFFMGYSHDWQATRLYRATPERYVLFICTRGETGHVGLLSRLEAARVVRTSADVLRKEFPELVGTVQDEA
jgi:hypothetical protein